MFFPLDGDVTIEPVGDTDVDWPPQERAVLS